jgi:threonine dehydrogenase-like Zn-dependent dehydrogenase
MGSNGASEGRYLSRSAGRVVLGHEFVGRVVDAGPDVTRLRVGDRVVSGAGTSCGRCSWCLQRRPNLCAEYRTLGLQVDGGLAEYVSSPSGICHPVPDACSNDAAAMTQPLAIALHALSRVGQSTGEEVGVEVVRVVGERRDRQAVARKHLHDRAAALLVEPVDVEVADSRIAALGA